MKNSKSWIISARIDVKIVADLYLYLTEQGIEVRSTSDLVRLLLTSIRDAKRPLEQQVPTAADALSVLETAGLTTQQVGTKRARSLKTQLEEEERLLDFTRGVRREEKKKKNRIEEIQEALSTIEGLTEEESR